jgi:prepilin-type N-terminal cleavage/methylation domain-containing protein
VIPTAPARRPEFSPIPHAVSHCGSHSLPGKRARSARSRGGFTLIELLIVVAIIAVLAAVAVPNFLLAQERAWISRDMANMRAIGVALQMYHVDHGDFPAADNNAGGFNSMGGTDFGNAPAAGGNWSGIPWILYERGYVEDWAVLFCPKYLKIYANGTTLKPEMGRKWEQFHHFRYAYNAAAIAFGGLEGGDFVEGSLEAGAWIIRDTFMSAELIENFAPPALKNGWSYPWGVGEYDDRIELMMDLDMSVKAVLGRTNFEDADVEAPPNSY